MKYQRIIIAVLVGMLLLVMSGCGKMERHSPPWNEAELSRLQAEETITFTYYTW